MLETSRSNNFCKSNNPIVSIILILSKQQLRQQSKGLVWPSNSEFVELVDCNSADEFSDEDDATSDDELLNGHTIVHTTP